MEEDGSVAILHPQFSILVLVLIVPIISRLDLVPHDQCAGGVAPAGLELDFVRRMRREPGAAHDADLAAVPAEFGKVFQ